MEHLRVGPFDLYPGERVLARDGQALELGARAFDLLLALAGQQGRLATKAMLMEKVWPKLVVDENNLPAQVAGLRRVLGADAIRTVSGYGYRLELPVSVVRDEVAAEVAAANQPAAQAPMVPAPPPASAVVRAPMAPQRLAPLVGRQAELQELHTLLGRGRLITIVGAAGAGKTRLAGELAAALAAMPGTEVAWVSLQAIHEAALLPPAVALAAGLQLPPDMDGYAGLQRLCAQRPLLVVLDNAEHLAEVLAGPLAALVHATAALRLLLTSQVPLGVAGEMVYRLASLPVPAPAVSRDAAMEYAAVQLFAQRAAAADQRFGLNAANASQVVEICRRLDGNPLAIELAAARVPALGVANLLERLDDRFQLLKSAHRSDDPRHEALQAAFDWSYRLLPAGEQKVFDLLGAFTGSFTLAAAAQCVADESLDTITAIDLVGRLVDRSLVDSVHTDPPRYRLLETARHYALERLRLSGRLQEARRRMTMTVLAVLDAAYREYWAVDERPWLARYEPELDNLRAAMDWAGEHDAQLGVALYGSAWPLYVEADLRAEAGSRFDRAVALIGEGQPRDRVGRFWNAVATYDSMRRWDRARYAAEVAASMHAAVGNAPAHYYALTLLALNWRGDEAAARAALDAARRIEDASWPPRLLAQGALVEAALLTSAGEFEAARAAYTRTLRLTLEGSERQSLAATTGIVELDIARGDLASALQLARPLALSLRHAGRRETRCELLALLFTALLLADERGEAEAAGAELYYLARDFDAGGLCLALDAMALLASHDRPQAAARILACADAAQVVRGQTRRRPAAERARAAAEARLDASLGDGWREPAGPGQQRLDEAGACALALGLGA